jgi:hypothetical protein
VVRVVASQRSRGPAHVKEGLPCQDAWLAVAAPRASLAVVCDGMGSRPRSREGARAATLAVRDAWRLWQRSPVGVVEDLIRIVEAAWRLRLREVAAEEAPRRVSSTRRTGTAVRRRRSSATGSSHGAQRDWQRSRPPFSQRRLRDSLTRWDTTLARRLVLHLRRAAGSERAARARHRWRIGGPRAGRIGDLATWVADETRRDPTPGRALARELRNWPVPHHRDDKTLLVMWKP